MPSISVPLKGQPGWRILQQQRREFWKQKAKNQLSANFKADEFYCHDGSAPPIVARPGMARLCVDFLEPMRKKFGTCFILSGYRHTIYNASIGGARHSQHIYEYDYESVATDLRFARGNPTEWAAYARELRDDLGHGGVGRYIKSGFVHVDNRGYKADWNQ